MAKQWINLAKGSDGWPRARTVLDGRGYIIGARWNDLEQLWSVHISKSDGTLLRDGLTARHGVDILEPFTGAEFPGGGLGRLKAWDGANRQADPGRDDLGRGDAVRLVYTPRADVLSAA